MRTKVLLSLAAFAVSAFAAYAQSNVYSVNVVGYVNKVLPANTQVAVANPLDNGTNRLDDVFGTLAKNSTASFWNGGGFDVATKTATIWNTNRAVPPGLGLFVLSKTAAVTNTFVGEVVVGPGESTTNVLPLAQVMVGSAIPYAGTINDTNIGLLGMAKNSTASFWNGGGYNVATKTATIWNTNYPINVADGFFISAKTTPYNWVQTLPAN
jgi:hypothetical protein